MTSFKRYALSAIFAVLSFGFITAANGDTTTIRSHQSAHWNWYGSIDNWAVFPDSGTSYRKINLIYTLGCPTGGCSDWDYTTQIFIKKRTGRYDSTATNYPYFSVNSTSPDSFLYANQATYTYFYDSTSSSTDSTLNPVLQIFIFNDNQNPSVITDTLFGFPANYYNYVYDSVGSIIDSVWVTADTTIFNSWTTVYNVFEVIDYIQIARYITPYGANLTSAWSNKWVFDITDYAPLLHDSIEISAFYSGWSDGFTVTLDFEFIEGTPPRTPIRVEKLWSGYFPYGDPNNSIENYLTPRNVFIGPNEPNAILRVDITGHGFGGNQNCAEFCPKNYQVYLDQTYRYQKLVWKADCGLNALYPQPGTWLYNRANWCPGDMVYWTDHELTPFMTSGDSLNINVDMDPFTNVNNSNPGYQFDGQLITFGTPNFSLDAELMTVLAPNNNPNYKRMNPVCKSPIVVIRNTGSTPLTSLQIVYGVAGAGTSTFNWIGNLPFLASDTVILPAPNWFGTSPVFTATIQNPNGQQDQLSDNNSLTVNYVAPPAYTNHIVFEVRTNNAAWQNSYWLEDENGNVIFSRSGLSNATTYRDTVNLNIGCYIFRLTDSGGDGLSFWANNSGTGYCRMKNGTTGIIFKSFQADFGSEIYQEFTSGYNLTVDEPLSAPRELLVYPNPAGEQLTLEWNSDGDPFLVEIVDISGRVLYSEQVNNNTGAYRKTISLGEFASGLYFVRITDRKGVTAQKFIRE
jgi:hypothetical protein